MKTLPKSGALLHQANSIPARSVNNFLWTSEISLQYKSSSKHRIQRHVYKISFLALRFLFFHRISFHKWAIIENETVLCGSGRARHGIKAARIDWTYKIFSWNSHEAPLREVLCIFLLCDLTFYSISAHVRPSSQISRNNKSCLVMITENAFL